MLKGHPKGSAPNPVTKISQSATPAHTYDNRRVKDSDADGYRNGGKVKSCGYADGGQVNTFRSDAEKKVDAMYGKPAPAPADSAATTRMNKKIEDAGG